MTELTAVKFFIKEADKGEKCVQCGWSGSGLTSYVVFIHYKDSRGEDMMSGWSFPYCIEHIPEQIKKYPSGSMTFPPESLEKKPNPFGHIPHAE